MAEDTTITDAITEKVTKAKSIRTDGVEVQQRDLRELIAADDHISKKATAQSGLGSIQFISFNRPGTVGRFP